MCSGLKNFVSEKKSDSLLDDAFLIFSQTSELQMMFEDKKAELDAYVWIQ